MSVLPPASSREDLGELWGHAASFQSLFRGSSSWGGVHQGEQACLGSRAICQEGRCVGTDTSHLSSSLTPRPHRDLCLSGIILSGNLLAKHLAINTQPRGTWVTDC